MTTPDQARAAVDDLVSGPALPWMPDMADEMPAVPPPLATLTQARHDRMRHPE
jgi:hypothetical protein